MRALRRQAFFRSPFYFCPPFFHHPQHLFSLCAARCSVPSRDHALRRHLHHCPRHRCPPHLMRPLPRMDPIRRPSCRHALPPSGFSRSGIAERLSRRDIITAAGDAGSTPASSLILSLASLLVSLARETTEDRRPAACRDALFSVCYRLPFPTALRPLSYPVLSTPYPPLIYFVVPFQACYTLNMHQTSTACHTPRTAHTLGFADTSKTATISPTPWGLLVRSCRATTLAWQPLYFCSCHALPEQLTGLEPRGLLPPPLPRRDPGLAYGLAWLG